MLYAIRISVSLTLATHRHTRSLILHIWEPCIVSGATGCTRSLATWERLLVQALYTLASLLPGGVDDVGTASGSGGDSVTTSWSGSVDEAGLRLLFRDIIVDGTVSFKLCTDVEESREDGHSYGKELAHAVFYALARFVQACSVAAEGQQGLKTIVKKACYHTSSQPFNKHAGSSLLRPDINVWAITLVGYFPNSSTTIENSQSHSPLYS